MRPLNIAILGYASDAGKALSEVLEDSGIEISEIFPLSYSASEYDAVSFVGKNYSVKSPDDFDFSEADVAIFLGNSGDAAKLIPEAQAEGVFVIDASGATEANKENLFCNLENFDADITKKKLLVPMNSEATMLSILLKPLKEKLNLSNAVVTLMEAVSSIADDGAGELARETVNLLNMKQVEPRLFKSQLAFNIHTVIGDCTSDGSTTHEDDIKKQLFESIGEPNDGISLTTVLAPVFYGHTASITFSLDQDSSLSDVRDAFEASPDLEIIDEDEITPTEYGE